MTKPVGLFVFWMAVPLLPAMTVALTPSTPGSAPVASIITFTANVSEAVPGTLWYRFRFHGYNQDSRLIKDYGPEPTVEWTAADHEGTYEIDVDVRNLSTGEIESSSVNFTLEPIVIGSGSVISATSHPMVFLYSAPECPAGSRMRAIMIGPEGGRDATSYQACQTGLTMNFYLAGMRGGTHYRVTHEIDSGSAVQHGRHSRMLTPPTPPDFTPVTVVKPAPPSLSGGIVLQSTLIANPFATDLSGNLVWYYPNSDITYITRVAKGGYFYAVFEAAGQDQSRQILRKVDLVGMTVLQTNAARVNEQLSAMGKRLIGAFHHEARELPDGRILVLADVEQILTNVQGAGDVDVIGDMILILDANLQVVWTWDTFDHLDTTRRATLSDQCSPGACPPLYLATTANDWIHGNSVQRTPDGNLIFSSRSQDMVYKIDYQDGAGTGNVIWRLGSGGDFQIQSSDPLPWFSHQHDPQITQDNTTLVLFDNGNLRNFTDSSQNSRGQVLELDEAARTAKLTLNYDIGQFSVALGAAQKLHNGDYYFDASYVTNGLTYSVEITADGNQVFSLNPAAPAYRSFHMPNLYSPPYGTH